MKAKVEDLGNATPISLDKINLDPNNPRIAPEPAPGYDDPELLFEPELQKRLVARVYEVYGALSLENSIIEQGWTPVDPIIVWEHPSGLGHVVVEGNTRISVLRSIRTRLPKEQAKLDRMKKGSFPPPEIQRQGDLIEHIKALIEATDVLRVVPVNAKSVSDLLAKLPRLLGVRHIKPARQWTPYATNLYIIKLYEKAFARLYGQKKVTLDDEALDEVARQVPLKHEEIRKSIQAAYAFGHFKSIYEERVQEAGNKFDDGDQYFFDNILSNKVAREEFGFGSDRLHLSEEAEEALFLWAFAKPRANGGGDGDAMNDNVLQKAEDIRSWQRIARYDAKTGVTNFAKRLSVSQPDDAIPIWQLETEQQAHRIKNTPVKTFADLLKALKDLKADTLKGQANLLRPMLEEIAQQVEGYLQMVVAASGGGGGHGG